MPKLLRSETETRAARIRSSIKAQMTFYGISPQAAAKAANMSQGGFYNRMRDPLDFRLRELAGLDRVLHFTQEQMEAFKI